MMQEIRIFFSTITDWIVLLVVFTFFFFSFNVEQVTVLGNVTILPVFSQPSFAAEFFTLLVGHASPAGVPLIVTSPMTAFVVQLKLSFLLAVFFTFPVFIWRLLSYLAPALYWREQRLLYLMVAPFTLLFFAGGYFAYQVLVPTTFRVLYEFTGPIGATALLGVAEFAGLAVALFVLAGATFTLPVMMVMLTALGAVGSSFWFKNARYALVIFLITSAIMTPDGSGVSMLLLSAPVSVLYGAGALVCVRVERAGQRGSNVGAQRLVTK